MTAKLCKYGCGTMLDGFDEEQRKFIEAGTGGLHTKERCQEAKNKLAQKDDHGNEEIPQAFTQYVKPTLGAEYVDHTATPELKLVIFTDPTPEGLALKNNNFAKEHKIKFSQSHVSVSQYTLYVWYEDVIN